MFNNDENISKVLQHDNNEIILPKQMEKTTCNHIRKRERTHYRKITNHPINRG